MTGISFTVTEALVSVTALVSYNLLIKTDIFKF